MFNGVLILILVLSVFITAVIAEIYRKFKDFDSLDFFLKSLPSAPFVTIHFPNPVVTPMTRDKVLIAGPASASFLDVDGFTSKSVSLKTLSLECSAPLSVVKDHFSIGNATITSSFGEFSSFSATFDNGCVVALDLV
jgi:hypothetical protein